MLEESLQQSERFIRYHEAGFTSGMPDEDWLPTVGRNGWLLISADTRLWRRSVQREVLFKWGVRAFIFSENNLRGETRAEILRKALPDMRKLVRETPPPFVASLTVEGHAHLTYDSAKHKRVTKSELRAATRHARVKAEKTSQTKR